MQANPSCPPFHSPRYLGSYRPGLKGGSMRKVTTSGKCSLCNDTFPKGAMANHLRACRGAHPQALLGKGNERTARIFHVTVEGRTRPDYWLHLEAPADATLADLDAFLRGIWLECCGHLSAFAIGRDAYSVAPEELGERSMAVPLERVSASGHRSATSTTSEPPLN